MSKFITGEQFNVGVKQVATQLNSKMELLPGKTIVKEISNPLTTSPLEYGQFRLSADTGALSVGQDIPFDEVINGNINISNGRFVLRANKTYTIDGSAFVQYSTSDGRAVLWFKDYTNNIYLGNASSVYATTSSTLLRGDNSSCKAIVTPEKDIEVGLQIYVSHSGDITNVAKAMSTITVQEIRNNPVNQYGGFETEVLFDGSAIDVATSYILNDNINNYNFIIVYAITQDGSLSHIIIPIDIINGMNDTFTQPFALGHYFDSKYSYLIRFKFDTRTSFKIATKQQIGWESKISKIIGIKGQLPSLLCGGEF